MAAHAKACTRHDCVGSGRKHEAAEMAAADAGGEGPGQKKGRFAGIGLVIWLPDLGSNQGPAD